MFIGIDPGVGGGIAAIDADGNVRLVSRMPETNRDLLDLLRSIGGRAVLEFVRSSPQMGVKSAFTFGCGYGGLRMALAACEIPFEEVTPNKWQSAIGIARKTGKTSFGETHKKDKNVSKVRAQELFPSVPKITHATADALLLAEYCRRVHTGVIIASDGRAPAAKTSDF